MRFDIMDPNTHVCGPHFLEASAGTGKTFSIEHLIPRLLLEVKTPISIEEILLVTFTRAATRELKARVYKTLLFVYKALAEEKGGPVYLEPFLINGQERLLDAKNRIEQAIHCFSSAQIFTLHSFCLRMLQEFAFDTEFFVTASVEEEEDKRLALRETIKDLFRTGLQETQLTTSQIRRVIGLREVNKDVDVLCQLIIKSLESGKKGEGCQSSQEQLEQWNKALKMFCGIDKQFLLQKLSDTYPRIARSTKWQDQIHLFFTFIEKGSCSLQEWDLFLQEKDFFLRELKGKSKSASSCTIFEELQNVFAPLYEQATNARKLLSRLIQMSEETYQKSKNKLSHYHPDDFVAQLKEALEKKETLVKQIQKKFPVLIIDEFQDTDQSQWELFYQLFLSRKDDLIALYLVGDPKQSIYRFRGADIYVYLQAKELFSSHECFQLDTNYRSHPQLVHALNTLFCSAQAKEWLPLPRLNKGLEVHPVKSSEKESILFEKDPQKGCVHFLLQDSKTSDIALLQIVAKEIMRLHTEVGISLDQIAILVKDRYQAAALQQVLQEASIPCQSSGGDEKQRDATQVLKDLLYVLQDPTDERRVKRILGGKLLGYSVEEINGSSGAFLLSKYQQIFSKAQGCFAKQGFGAFLFSFLQNTFRQEEEESIAEHVLQRQDPSLYFSLRQFTSRFLELNQQKWKNPGAILDFLEEEDSFLGKEKHMLLREQEEEIVQIMTLHKSKGLEFPIVFALGVQPRHRNRESDLDQREHEEVDAEKLRLFYVALTRAKERVYVPATLSQGEVLAGEASAVELFLGGSQLERYALSSVYEQISNLSSEKTLSHLQEIACQANITYEYVKETSIVSLSPLQEMPVLSLPIRHSREFSKEFLLSFSSLRKEEKNELLIHDVQDLPLGAKTGVIIHAILEEFCKTPKKERTDIFLLELITELCAHSILEGKEEIILQIIQNTMKIKIESKCDSFSLGDLDHTEMRPEVEFLYPVGGSFMKGFIDLVCRIQGRYYLVDWKTNALGKSSERYTQEQMWQCMKENNYELQAFIYTEALKKWLCPFEKKNFSQCFGGVIYMFLRGGSYLLFDPSTFQPGEISLERIVWSKV